MIILKANMQEDKYAYNEMQVKVQQLSLWLNKCKRSYALKD